MHKIGKEKGLGDQGLEGVVRIRSTDTQGKREGRGRKGERRGREREGCGKEGEGTLNSEALGRKVIRAYQ